MWLETGTREFCLLDSRDAPYKSTTGPANRAKEISKESAPSASNSAECTFPVVRARLPANLRIGSLKHSAVGGETFILVYSSKELEELVIIFAIAINVAQTH